MFRGGQNDDCVAMEKPPHQFGFPFQPYDIQIKLMQVAFDTYENEKYAILESPTGTGKSLSLICSAISWLRRHKSARQEKLHTAKQELLSKIDVLKKEEESSGDWLSVQTKRQEVSRELESINKHLEYLDKFDQRNEARRHARLHNVPLENYASILDSESIANRTLDTTLNETRDENSLITNSGSVHQTTIADVTLNEIDDQDMEKSITKKQEEDYVRPKIFYASRTHSQLSQFVNEVKRTDFANLDLGPSIKLTALASRANLCVNPEVHKLRDPSAINERCMEMQKESKPENRCPFIKAKQLNVFKDDILTSVHDIEDLASRGRAHGSCPYYAARLAIPEAELVVLPYNNMLHRETRMASALDLKDSVVIVDEAHNILETICSIHSAPIDGLQLVGSHTILSRYYQRYRARMNPKNAAMVKTIVQCLTALIRYLSDPRSHLSDYDCPKSVNLEQEEEEDEDDDKVCCKPTNKTSGPRPRQEEFMVGVTKFVGASNLERFNVYKIIDYFNRSQLARKLLGLFKQDNSLDFDLELYGLEAQDVAEKKRDAPMASSSPKRKRQKTSGNARSVADRQCTVATAAAAIIPQWEQTNLSFLKPQAATIETKLKKKEIALSAYPMYALIEFFRALTNAADDGRVLTNFKSDNIFQSSLKFILLNPSSQFKQMTQEARSIILAGGTMQPFNEFTDLLFGPLGVDEARLNLFSCGHVIAKDNLYVASLATGPSGKPLELSYKVKSSLENIDEIGRALANIVTIAPGGMICFLPSYDYEQLCFNRWKQTGIISRIETRSKQVFREPRLAGHLKPVFDEYSRAIEKGRTSGRGALLFCVVGGKMSEGINFNDDLGRCVVMIGMPYANIKSSELQQRMLYYDRTCKRAPQSQTSAGQQYYENLCIKGINQSIGRSIRHKNDYAGIVLLDRRYASKSNIKMGLPAWIRQSLCEHERFGPMFSQLKNFYNNVQSC